MTMTEARRHQLYQALKERLGDEPAETLMEAIPPVGWADVATKRDLDALGLQLRTEFRSELHTELGTLQRTIFFQMLASQATVAGLLGGLIVAVG